MAMLEVKDLHVHYGVIEAIKGISFEVNQGEVIALIGANGAGKTTTLHTITGLIKPTSGSIIFEGKDITKTPGYKIVPMGTILYPGVFVISLPSNMILPLVGLISPVMVCRVVVFPAPFAPISAITSP